MSSICSIRSHKYQRIIYYYPSDVQLYNGTLECYGQDLYGNDYTLIWEVLENGGYIFKDVVLQGGCEE